MPLSSLLDVPAQLALVLSFAAATAANDPPSASPAIAPPPPAAVLATGPLEGPYRFSEEMWLRALKEHLPQEAHHSAQSIFRTSGGRYYVPRQAERQQILDARNDPGLAASAARALARANARALRLSLDRAPTAGELLIAHILGPEAAASFIAQARSHPSEAAAKRAPEIAGRAQELLGARAASLTLAGLYTRLTSPLDEARIDASRASHEMEPTMADMLRRGGAWGALRPNAVAWQTEVSAGESASPPQ
jgi:hypothetical protein